MGIVGVLVFVALALSAVGVGLFVWAVHAGQFDSLDVEAERALHDGPPLDDEP